MSKKSFAEIQADVQAQKNNSDLLNLANALERVRQHRQLLDDLEKQILAMAADVEAGKLVDVSELKKLYNATYLENRRGM